MRFQIKHHSQSGQGAPSAKHAAYILRDAEYGKTQAHVGYILRQTAQVRGREDLIHSEVQNLPGWAEGSAARFFDAADQYEGVRRRVSTTLEIALPRELPRDEQIALMQDYCRSQFGDRLPYAAALHESQTAHGGANPHFHVIWSARITDGIEREPAEHFRRPPHGPGKDPLFAQEKMTMAQRQAWADLHNIYMERAGLMQGMVDPRTLQQRGIDRAPEQRVDAEITAQAKYRGVVAESWQQVLKEREARAAQREAEQAEAAAYWVQRKEVLGLTDVRVLSREEIVEQIGQATRSTAQTAVSQTINIDVLRTELAQLQRRQDVLGRAQRILDDAQRMQRQPSVPQRLAIAAALVEDEAHGRGLTMHLYDKERDGWRR